MRTGPFSSRSCRDGDLVTISSCFRGRRASSGARERSWEARGGLPQADVLPAIGVALPMATEDEACLAEARGNGMGNGRVHAGHADRTEL